MNNLVAGSIIGLATALHAMVASSDPLDIGIASIIKKHERSYQEECLDLSIIERIQLSRMPDRRKSKALDCQLAARYARLWSDAFENIDLQWHNTQGLLATLLKCLSSFLEKDLCHFLKYMAFKTDQYFHMN